MIPTMRAASTPSRRVTISDSNMGRSLPGPPGSSGGHRSPRFRAAVAEAGDLQRVVRRHETVGAADLGLERGDPRAHELHHPAAGRAHQVIVALPAVDVLVEETPARELLLRGETALDQEVQVPVDGGAGDLRAARLEGLEQLLGVDMAVLGEDLLEERQALLRHPLAPAA